MLRHTDGRLMGSWKNGGRTISRQVTMSVTCLVFWGLVGQAAAQTTSAASAGGGLQAQIRKLDATAGERIELLAGRSALMDVNRPLRRAAVGDPEVAEVTIVSPQQAMLSGRGVGSTSLILWDDEENQLTYGVIVQFDVEPLRLAIADIVPGTAVQVRSLGDKIILRGTVADVDTAERIVQLAQAFTASGGTQASGGPSGGAGGGAASLGSISGGAQPGSSGGSAKKQVANIINQLIVAGEHQVLLRCTVAEVNKTATRQLGINGWLAGENVRDMFVVNQIAGINPVNIGAAADQNVALPVVFATDRNGLALQATPELSLGFPRMQMQMFFRAMRDNRLLRVLAEPNLVALSGQEASFLAGGEFATVTSGITGSTIEWKEFGVRLRFTPTVIGRQMIRLRVAPEVSDLDPTTGISTPDVQVPGGLIQRRAETTIELASGSTIAIAGLLNETARSTIQKMPGLGDVPVLGALFSSVSYQKDITELVILVTPEIATSMQPDQVDPVPGQFSRDPSDFELFGLGMMEGKPACDNTNPAEALETRTPPRYPKYGSPPEQMTLHGPWGPADAGETTR